MKRYVLIVILFFYISFIYSQDTLEFKKIDEAISLISVANSLNIDNKPLHAKEYSDKAKVILDKILIPYKNYVIPLSIIIDSSSAGFMGTTVTNYHFDDGYF